MNIIGVGQKSIQWTALAKIYSHKLGLKPEYSIYIIHGLKTRGNGCVYAKICLTIHYQSIGFLSCAIK